MENVSRSLHSVWTIFKQEFNMFFVSPIVYLIGAVWLGIAGLFFALSLSTINSGQTEPTMQGMFFPMVFLMMFVAPALTMRLMSEEIRTGTHELLQTAPIRDWEIVVGKWLAVWMVFTVFILASLLFLLVLVVRGNPDGYAVFTGYLGLWLLGGATMAIGLLASSLTQFQPIAFMIAMGTILFLWLTDVVTQIPFISQQFLLDLMSELSLQSHYRNMIQRAVIRPVDIMYFLGLSAVCLFIAAQILNSRRWRA